MAATSSPFQHTEREKAQFKHIGQSAMMGKAISAIMVAMGVKTLSGKSAIKEITEISKKHASGDKYDVGNFGDGFVEKSQMLAAQGEQIGIDNMSMLYERFGRLAIEHPVLHDVVTWGGAALTGAITYALINSATSTTYRDFHDIYEGGYEPHIRNAFWHQGDLYKQKYAAEGLKRSFQNNLTNFCEKFSLSVNGLLTSIGMAERKNTEMVFYALDKDIPSVAGLVKALYDLKKDNSANALSIKGNKGDLFKQELKALLDDTESLAQYFEMNKMGIRQFNQAVLGALGKDAAYIFKDAHDVSKVQDQWHSLRKEVLSKTFKKISLSNLQARFLDSVDSFSKAKLTLNNEDSIASERRVARDDLRKAKDALQTLNEEFNALAPFTVRNEHTALKDTIRQAKQTIRRVLTSELSDIDDINLTERAGLSQAIFGERSISPASFKAHYISTLLSSVKDKIFDGLNKNDSVKAKLDGLSDTDITDLCAKHGVAFTGDTSVLLEALTDKKVRNIKLKVFADFDKGQAGRTLDDNAYSLG